MSVWKELQPEEILETAHNVAVVSRFLNGETPLPVNPTDENKELFDAIRRNVTGFISLCYQSLADPRVDIYFSTNWIALLEYYSPSLRRDHAGDWYAYMVAIGLRRTPQQTPDVYLVAKASRSFCEHPPRALASIDPQELRDSILRETYNVYQIVRSFEDDEWECAYKESDYSCRSEREKQRRELEELDAKYAPLFSRAADPKERSRLDEEKAAIRNRELATDPLRIVTLTRSLQPEDITKRPFLIVPFIRGLNAGFVSLRSHLLGELSMTVGKEDGLLRVATGFEQAYQILEQVIRPQTR